MAITSRKKSALFTTRYRLKDTFTCMKRKWPFYGFYTTSDKIKIFSFPNWSDSSSNDQDFLIRFFLFSFFLFFYIFTNIHIYIYTTRDKWGDHKYAKFRKRSYIAASDLFRQSNDEGIFFLYCHDHHYQPICSSLLRLLLFCCKLRNCFTLYYVPAFSLE